MTRSGSSAALWAPMEPTLPSSTAHRRRIASIIVLFAACLAWFTVATPVRPAAAASAGKVSGVVRDTAGAPVAGAVVSVAGSSDTPVRTNGAGAYSINNVLPGEHTVTVNPVCKPAVSQPIAVDGNKQLNFTVQERTRRTASATPPSVRSTHLRGDDRYRPVRRRRDHAGESPVQLPVLRHAPDDGLHLDQRFSSFTAPSTEFANTPIPAPGGPDAAIYAFWDDLVVDQSSGVGVITSGNVPFRVFSILWTNVRIRASSQDDRLDFEIQLSEDGGIELLYAGIHPSALEEGGSATMGIENDSGTIGVQDSFNVRHLNVSSDSSVFYEPNRAPIADAGQFFGDVGPGATLPLNGTASFDPDGDVLRYAWKQTFGPATTIVDPTSPKTSAKAPAGNVEFQLRVVDSYGKSDTESIFFQVTEAEVARVVAGRPGTVRRSSSRPRRAGSMRG